MNPRKSLLEHSSLLCQNIDEPGKKLYRTLQLISSEKFRKLSGLWYLSSYKAKGSFL